MEGFSGRCVRRLKVIRLIWGGCFLVYGLSCLLDGRYEVGVFAFVWWIALWEKWLRSQFKWLEKKIW